MISATLIEQLVEEIKQGKTTIKEAAVKIAKPCYCAILNTKRTEKILQEICGQC